MLDRTEGFVLVEVASDRENNIIGTVESVEEIGNVVECGLLDMADVGTDGAPAVRVVVVAERT